MLLEIEYIPVNSFTNWTVFRIRNTHESQEILSDLLDDSRVRLGDSSCKDRDS